MLTISIYTLSVSFFFYSVSMHKYIYFIFNFTAPFEVSKLLVYEEELLFHLHSEISVDWLQVKINENANEHWDRDKNERQISFIWFVNLEFINFVTIFWWATCRAINIKHWMQFDSCHKQTVPTKHCHRIYSIFSQFLHI